MIKLFEEYIDELDNISNIDEAANKNSFFMELTSPRITNDFTFKENENVILIKYDTDGYTAQNRGVYKIGKVNKNLIRLNSDDDYMKEIKFDKYGISVQNIKNKYRGNSTLYWVLYNSELLEEESIKGLLNKGANSWGFRYRNNTDIQDLKNDIKELHN